MHGKKHDLATLLGKLSQSNTIFEVDHCLCIYIDMLRDGTVEESSELTLLKEICTLFVVKICSVFLFKNDVCRREYLYLLLIFSKARFDIQEENKIYGNLNDHIRKLDLCIDISKSQFMKLGNRENIMLLELGFLCNILKGNLDEGIKSFIKGVLCLDFRLDGTREVASFILNSFDLLKIPFHTLAEAIIDAFDSLFNKNAIDRVTQRSVFNWQLHVFWNVKSYFNNKDWLILYPYWRSALRNYLDAGDIDMAMYVQFFMCHMCGNNYESEKEWATFNEEISRPASKVYADYIEHYYPVPIQPPGEKIIVGILKDRIVLNSVYKVEFSLLRNFIKSQYSENVEIRLYLMSLIEKSQNEAVLLEEIASLGIIVIDVVSDINRDGYYNSHLQKSLTLLDRIRRDRVEILISPNNGYGISDFLMSSRCSKAMVFYSHGNFAYNIDGITDRLTHICGNQRTIEHRGFTFNGVSVKIDGRFYNPPIDKDEVSRVKNSILDECEFGKEAIVFGLIGRLVKMDNINYLEVLLKIMNDYPSVFLACGTGNKKSIIEKIKSINSSMIKRFHFIGFVNPDIYGHVIDIWPDSFPMQHGESRIEFRAKGGLNVVLSTQDRKTREKSIVDMVNDNLDCLKSLNLSKEQLHSTMLDDRFVAFNKKDYESKVRNLIENQATSRNLLLQQHNIMEIIKVSKGNKMMFDFLNMLHNRNIS